MTPDLAARRLLMSAHLYYDHSQPILSDAENDALAKYVSDHFDDLHPTRIWQLRNRKIILATTHHVKLTTQTIEASHAWYYSVKGSWPLHCAYCTSTKPYKESPTNGRYYQIGG